MNWKILCHLNDVPTQGMKVIELDGIHVLIVRSELGVFAIPPLCPHMEEPLVSGLCDGTSLICLKHLWQWDLETGEPVGEAETPLLKYGVRTESDGTVWIDMEKELFYNYRK